MAAGSVNGLPKVIFANMSNELMLTAPSAVHGGSLREVSPRKLWLAHEGDVVVTPRPVDEKFKRYVCAVLGIDPDAVTTLSPDSSATERLSEALRSADLVAPLAALIAERPGVRMLPFAMDRPTLALAEELEIPFEGYDPLPGPGVRELMYRLNTKSGFRAVATGLGLQVVPGFSCEGLPALTREVGEALAAGWDVLVKLDRSSNGYGHVPVRHTEVSAASLEEVLRAGVARFAEQPLIFTVERLMPFVSVPSIEIAIEDAGTRLLYICDQRCPNGSFSGMVTPPEELPDAVERELQRAADLFGAYTHDLGFRGICDVDAGVTADGEVYVTESNFRRTGGTYLDALARRLLGEAYLDSHVWVADARRGRADLSFFEAWDGLQAAGLAWNADAREGVLLTADSVAFDGKWRYLILATDLERSGAIESRLEDLLSLSW